MFSVYLSHKVAEFYNIEWRGLKNYHIATIDQAYISE